MLKHFFILLTIAVALMYTAAFGQTPQPAPSRQWQKIAELPTGTPLIVREQGKQLAQVCTLVWIDNAALACDAYALDGGTQRLVYPIASIASVARQPSPEEKDSRFRLKATLFGMGVGGLAGGLAAKGISTDAGFAGAAVGSLLGGSLVIAATNGPPRPMWAVSLPFRSRRF
jgi:hypothetical protein